MGAVRARWAPAAVPGAPATRRATTAATRHLPSSQTRRQAPASLHDCPHVPSVSHRRRQCTTMGKSRGSSAPVATCSSHQAAKASNDPNAAVMGDSTGARTASIRSPAPAWSGRPPSGQPRPASSAATRASSSRMRVAAASSACSTLCGHASARCPASRFAVESKGRCSLSSAGHRAVSRDDTGSAGQGRCSHRTLAHGSTAASIAAASRSTIISSSL